MRKICFLLLLIVSISVAQDDKQNNEIIDALHLREVPRHNMLLAFGVLEPTGDYKYIARSGLSLSLGYDFYFNKNWALSTSLKRISNQNALYDSNDRFSPDRWNSYSFSIGSVYSYTDNRFQLDVFARLGGTTLTVTEDLDYTNTIYSVNNDSKSVSFIAETGLRLNYYFRRSVQLYFSPQYMTTLGKPYSLNLIEDDTIVSNAKGINMSNLTFSIGIKFALTSAYSNGELRDDD